jgi:chlorobactene glucosyltransferase
LSPIWHWAGVGSTAFVALLFLIALSNLHYLRRLGSYGPPARTPPVSILVPARNEERSIERCLRSLLAQDYPEFEVVVLDDQSTDGTPDLIAEMAGRESKLVAVQGVQPPAGWLGKQWACYQLAQAATGELLLFTDADTVHEAQALSRAVAALFEESADLLSAMPRQEVTTWSEKLVIPVMPWSFFAFLPLGIAFRVKASSLAAAVGQFMLFRRSAYDRVGGHRAVRQDLVEDIALARLFKARGRRWRLVDGEHLLSCRMYGSWSEVRDGFSKNLWAAFGYRLPLFLVVCLCLAIAFWQPLGTLVLSMVGAALPWHAVAQAILAVVLSLGLWSVSHLRFHFPLWLVPLYPASILLLEILAVRSIVVTLAGRGTWKGRSIARPTSRGRR